MFHKWREAKERRSAGYKFSRYLGTVLVTVLIFGAGWFTGSGRLNIGPGSGLHQTVNSQLPEDLDYADVESVYDSLRQNYDGSLERDELLNGLKQGIANATGDPYTEYLDAQESREFNEQLNGTFTGIGAELSKDPETNTIVVIAPLSGFPAERAGLRAKDVIAEIDGESAYDISVSEAVKKIRGPEGTPVKLGIIRGGQSIDIDIIRETIKIPSVEYETLEGNIGYIKISRFAEDTKQLVTEAANKFKSENVKGVILDLRNDPGGLLDAAVDVSSLWLDNKEILTERRGDEVIKTFRSTGTPVLNGVKTVVLINEGSASASEITAGALRDNDAATLIGVKTFGKGSVQQLINFRDGGQLKVTVARWFTPAGKNIDKEGIKPDTEVKMTDEDYEKDRDPQLDRAKAMINN